LGLQWIPFEKFSEGPRNINLCRKISWKVRGFGVWLPFSFQNMLGAPWTAHKLPMHCCFLPIHTGRDLRCLRHLGFCDFSY
jgi:hypothetical protein